MMGIVLTIHLIGALFTLGVFCADSKTTGEKFTTAALLATILAWPFMLGWAFYRLVGSE